MAVYIYTGKLGGGKSLCAVARIREKLLQSLPVATNININLLNMCKVSNRTARIIRVPDKPSIYDLESIGNGNHTYDESLNGLLVLDECGTWFNSRNWQDKSRKPVNDWFLHARKLGWDVILIIQNISILDSQARDAIAEHTAFCSRLDRINIPILGSVFKLFTGKRLPLPRIHTAKIVYGTNPQDLLSDRHTYRGDELFSCYDTKQAFTDNYQHGPYCLLTPWHIRGRYLKPRDWRYFMKATRIYWKRFNRPVIAFFASMITATLTYSYARIEPSLSVQDFVVDRVEESESEPTFSDRLDGYYYAGRTTINGQTTYRFIHPDRPELTSSSHLLKTAAYRETSYCVIEIYKGSETVVLQCDSSVPDVTI
jgi:hypothetical protein